jgi:alkylation response protein AidB-like acyl-CoA dehydrogenase
MIAFEPSEVQRRYQREAREFAEHVLRPAGYQLDRAFEASLFRRTLESLVNAGYTSMVVPPAFGGAGWDNLTTALVLEELAAGSAGFASALAASFHAASVLLIAGTEAQQRRFLPLLARHDAGLAAMAITEHEAGGSDIVSLGTLSHRDGDEYVLSGVKCFVTNAGAAAFYVILASQDPRLGRAGLRMFLVPSDAPGLTVTRFEDTVGMRASRIGELCLRDLRLPASSLIGECGSAYPAALQTLDRGRAFYGAIAVGVARAAYEAALAFARKRTQFGAPIFRRQAISFALADMATEIEAARLLVWRACWLMDQEEDCTKEASMAKLYASEAAVRVTTDVLQILGKAGHSRDHPADMFARDASALRVMEGTNHIQRIVIATQL